MKLIKNLDGIKFGRDFVDDLILVTNTEGLSAPVKKSDGSFLYPNAWFKYWDNFNNDLYKVTREDGLSTLIRIIDGSYVVSNGSCWVKDWKKFNNNYYKVIDENNLANLLRKEDGLLLLDEWVPKNNIEVLSDHSFSVLNHDTLNIYKD